MSASPAKLGSQLYDMTVNSSLVSTASSIVGRAKPTLDQKRLMISFLVTFLRDFGMAFAVRGGVGLLPRLIQLLRDKRFDLLNAMLKSFGWDAARFGLFVSLFFSTYKVSERLVKYWRNEKNDRWNSLAAGAIASLSLFIMEADESFRWTFSQYLAVRAGQCLYNNFYRANPQLAGYFYYGDVALFSLSTAQLMYAFFVRNETIDSDYERFVQRVACADRRLVQANRDFLRADTGKVNVNEVVDVAVIFEEATGISVLPDELVYALVSGENLTAMPCSLLHYGHDCWHRLIDIWSMVFKQAFPMYFSLHMVPTLIFRMKQLVKDPSSQVLFTIKNTLQSASFLATCVTVYQSFLCAGRAAFSHKLLQHDWKYYYWVIGLFAGSTILIEKKPRRAELALYLLPKAATSFYRALRNRNLILPIPRGDFFLFSISMAILMSYYQHEPESMSPIIRRILEKFLI